MTVPLLAFTLVTLPAQARFRPERPGAGVEQRNKSTSDQNTRELIIKIHGRTYRVVLSVGALGLATIFLLLSLLFIAVVLAVFAGRSARRAIAANRRLKAEIAERELSEDKLRRATELIRAVAQTSPLAMWAIDAEGRVTFWNPAAERIFGWSLDEVVQRKLPVVCKVKKDESASGVDLETMMSTVTEIKLPVSCKDGTFFDANVWTAVLTDRDGCIVGTLGVAADVTEQNRWIEKLRLSELHFQQLADSMPQIVWTANGNGEIEYLNRRWTEYSDSIHSADLRKDFDAFLHPDDRPSFAGGWHAAVEAKRPYETECRLGDSRTGGYRWFLCRALPLHDMANDLRWFGTFTDINQQKTTERTLHRANQELEQFAYAAAHDMQEPLRNVVLLLSMLQDERGHLNDGTENTLLAQSINNAQRMHSMVKDLLTFSRALDNKEPTDDRADAALSLEHALANLETAIKENGAEIRYDALPLVRIQPLHLTQLFQNLLGNSLKYRRPDLRPVIRVAATTADHECIFSIADNGIGFDPAYSQRIFGVFKRLHHHRDYPGTGIGLAICARIVSHYGGRIWAESQLGAGATFFFSLPGSVSIPETHLPTSAVTASPAHGKA